MNKKLNLQPLSLSLNRRFVRLACIALLGAAGMAFSYFRIFDVYELQTYDWRFKLRGDRPVSDLIAIIEIEESTLENIGQWPFDRRFHAELIDRLARLGARAVVFDILFVESGASDEWVANSARAAGNVYFANAFGDPKRNGSMFVSEAVEADLLPLFAGSAKGVGFVNVKPDEDGKRRKIYPAIVSQGKEYLHLSLRVAADTFGAPSSGTHVSRDGRAFEIGGLRLPLDENGFFLVNYAARWHQGFKHYSYADVLYATEQLAEGQTPIIDVSALKDKICFVGLSALGSHDTSPIPLQPVYPMMGLYANVLNSVLTRDFVVRADRFFNLAALILGALWIFVVSSRFRPIVALASAAGSLVAFSAAAVALFSWFGFWMDLFYPAAVFMLIYAAATLSRALFEMKKRELIENELRIASTIQQSFLPQSLPKEKGIEFAVYMKPAKQVGGDLYAFIPLGEGRVGVMLGDVSGKGTPAALFMAKVVSEFKYSARDRLDPAAVLVALNDSIASESTGGLFVTLVYLIFDVPNRKFIFSNAGHLPVVTVRAYGASDLLSIEEGMPIGVLPGASYANFECALENGQCFALYSDGVSEARDKRKREYGIEALQKRISTLRSQSAQDVLDKTVSDLQRFTGRAEQHDDITLLVAKTGAS